VWRCIVENRVRSNVFTVIIIRRVPINTPLPPYQDPGPRTQDAKTGLEPEPPRLAVKSIACLLPLLSSAQGKTMANPSPKTTTTDGLRWAQLEGAAEATSRGNGALRLTHCSTLHCTAYRCRRCRRSDMTNPPRCMFVRPGDTRASCDRPVDRFLQY
jgi:hypothetical protein